MPHRQPGHAFLLAGALWRIVDHLVGSGGPAAVEHVAVAGVVHRTVDRQEFLLVQAGRVELVPRQHRVDLGGLGGRPAQLGLRQRFLQRAGLVDGGRDVSDEAVGIVARHRQRAGEHVRAKRARGRRARAEALPVAEIGGLGGDLGFGDVAGRAGADQHEARLGVCAIQRALRAAQHFDLLDGAQALVAQSAKRNAVDVHGRAVDDEGIRLDAADRQERAADLAQLIELHIWRVLVDRAQPVDTAVADVLLGQHGGRHRRALDGRVFERGGDDDSVEGLLDHRFVGG